jgi:putative transposase
MQKAEKYLELINLQAESGLSIKDFCENYGLVRSSFYYWAKKLNGKTKRSKFIPLVVKPEVPLKFTPKNNPLKKASGERQELSFTEPMMEIVYPNGVLIRLKGHVNAEQVKGFIHLQE